VTAPPGGVIADATEPPNATAPPATAPPATAPPATAPPEAAPTVPAVQPAGPPQTGVSSG
jgi:ubiquitin thioesterase OTU1